jgi:hypothetical protein
MVAFQRLEFINGICGASYDQSISVLLDCWEAISPENILKAWNVVDLE